VDGISRKRYLPDLEEERLGSEPGYELNITAAAMETLA
jgi:hypothetical protein